MRNQGTQCSRMKFLIDFSSEQLEKSFAIHTGEFPNGIIFHMPDEK